MLSANALQRLPGGFVQPIGRFQCCTVVCSFDAKITTPRAMCLDPSSARGSFGAPHAPVDQMDERSQMSGAKMSRARLRIVLRTHRGARRREYRIFILQYLWLHRTRVETMMLRLLKLVESRVNFVLFSVGAPDWGRRAAGLSQEPFDQPSVVRGDREPFDPAGVQCFVRLRFVSGTKKVDLTGNASSEVNWCCTLDFSLKIQSHRRQAPCFKLTICCAEAEYTARTSIGGSFPREVTFFIRTDIPAKSASSIHKSRKSEREVE